MTELEFVIDGLVVIGVWTMLSVAGAICWSLWSSKVVPPPPPPIYRSRWKFKYTEMAPPARGRFSNVKK